MAFDQGSREMPILDTSLNLLPEQHMRVYTPMCSANI